MNDIKGNELYVGDAVIVTVSRKSHYLTSAIILEINVDNIKVRLSSTIAIKTLTEGDFILKYVPKPRLLVCLLNTCFDCVGTKILPGSDVYYKHGEEVREGKVTEVLSKNWVRIAGEKIRNEGVFVCTDQVNN